MDAVDLDVWIAAQNPEVLQEIRQLDSPRNSVDLDNPEIEEDDGNALANGGMRNKAIREAGFTLGAQTALAWRYDKLLAFTKSQEGTLDRIASFSPFIRDEYMLLPSVVESRDRFELSPNDDRLRTVRVQYQVTETPKAITQAPTWRDYLWREFPYPDDPHPALMPRSSRERAVWARAIDDGWESGLRQAELIWEDNLNTLVRDIRGRITYRILEARNIVQSPIMNGSEPEMTFGDDGKVVNAGDTVYSVTVPMEFKEQGDWGALWVSTDDTNYDPDFNYEVATPSSVQPVFGE